MNELIFTTCGTVIITSIVITVILIMIINELNRIKKWLIEIYHKAPKSESELLKEIDKKYYDYWSGELEKILDEYNIKEIKEYLNKHKENKNGR